MTDSIWEKQRMIEIGPNLMSAWYGTNKTLKTKALETAIAIAEVA